MQIRTTAAALLTAVCLTLPALGQDAAPVENPCPSLSVTSPALVAKGDKLTVTVSVSDGDPQVTPTYNWTVSDGFIEEGQGTSTITVNTDETTGTTITATVDVGGYDRSCSTSDSSTTEIQPKEEKPAEDAKPPSR